MTDTPQPPEEHISNAAYASAFEAKRLRRKVQFWRNLAWTLLGIAAVIVVVVCHRAATRCQQSRLALEEYGNAAQFDAWVKEARQGPIHLQLIYLELETQWDSLPNASPAFGPSGFIPIVRNWLKEPDSGESLPMAISRMPISLIYKSGRHVLYRDERGLRVEWIDEQDAAPILEHIRP